MSGARRLRSPVAGPVPVRDASPVRRLGPMARTRPCDAARLALDRDVALDRDGLFADLAAAVHRRGHVGARQRSVDGEA